MSLKIFEKRPRREQAANLMGIWSHTLNFVGGDSFGGGGGGSGEIEAEHLCG